MDFVKTNDGTNTLYSSEFNEHYHSIKDGALNESLNKHIIPAFKYLKQNNNNREINILDICFGLGYNSLATIYYLEDKLNTKINIYSPEFDLNLIKSLKNFEYPKEFEKYKNIINNISDNLKTTYKNFTIKVINKDAREFINSCEVKFDIIYQDAFSSSKNPTLWSYEYFKSLKLKESAILTTYSIATPIRLTLFNNNFHIYENLISTKKATIATTFKLDDLNEIDMNLKLKRNPNAKMLFDN